MVTCMQKCACHTWEMHTEVCNQHTHGNMQTEVCNHLSHRNMHTEVYTLHTQNMHTKVCISHTDANKPQTCLWRARQCNITRWLLLGNKLRQR